jgi:hypothetical protein
LTGSLKSSTQWEGFQNALVCEVADQLNIAVSPEANSMYEEVAWGSRFTSCTDLQAVDHGRLCLERTTLISQCGIIPSVINGRNEFSSGSDTITDFCKMY